MQVVGSGQERLPRNPHEDRTPETKGKDGTHQKVFRKFFGFQAKDLLESLVRNASLVLILFDFSS